MAGELNAATERSPTIAELRPQGITGVRVRCMEPGCMGGWTRFTFRALGLLDDETFGEVHRFRFRCRKCGSMDAGVEADVDVSVPQRRMREMKEAEKGRR